MENQNEGYRRLLIDVVSDGAPISIVVQFTPGETVMPVPVLAPQPLKQWSGKNGSPVP